MKSNGSSDQGTTVEMNPEALIRLAKRRARMGVCPPPEIYRVEVRRLVDWSEFPEWARPSDPQMFDGCCHEG
ncbi:MAG: hypothetical protein R3E01_19460 [Pirellulaceae bacterium]|nr:hypothetical protein [Planctomycetales bacterium]